MLEAPIVQYVGAQAARDTRREDILKLLAARLQPEAARAFKPGVGYHRERATVGSVI